MIFCNSEKLHIKILKKKTQELYGQYYQKEWSLIYTTHNKKLSKCVADFKITFLC